MTWRGIDVTKNTDHNIIMGLPGLVHELTQEVDGEHNVRARDCEINHMEIKSSKRTGIKKQITISVVELKMLFHWKGRRTSTKVTTISKNVKSIFSLIKEDVNGRVNNF